MKIVRFFMVLSVILLGIVAGYYILHMEQSIANGQAHEEGEEEGHSEHETAGAELEEKHIELTPEQIQVSGIVVETAGPQRIQNLLQMPGEIALNSDRLAHVVPRLSGVVVEVRKVLGDTVDQDEVLAVIESRDLADAKSEYFAAVRLLEFARKSLDREELLWKQKISPEEDYLSKRYAVDEAQIKAQTAHQKLKAIGVSEAQMESVLKNPEAALSRYEIRSPLSGTLIEKHITLGESVQEDSDIFVVADLSSVWAEITVYSKQLPIVNIGQTVWIRSDDLNQKVEATLSYIGPVVGEQTRSVRARAVLSNSEGIWLPGIFVTVELLQNEEEVPVAVKTAALQSYRNETVVFVQHGNGFEPRPVKPDRRGGEWVEILSGISAGETYVAENSFILKADLEKEGASHDH